MGLQKEEGSFHAYVLREILKHENRPEIIVDRGILYRGFTKTWFKIQTRLVNAIESFFSRFKGRRDSGTDFLSSFECRAGWRVLWHSIITGSVYLDSPVCVCSIQNLCQRLILLKTSRWGKKLFLNFFFGQITDYIQQTFGLFLYPLKPFV